MKRIIDFIIGILGVIILSPLFLFISVCILIYDGTPVFFKQTRVGKDNKEFRIYKFRTMKNGTGDIATKSLKDANKKITSVGKILRVTSIDEIPQLFNLINGTMSLVGPRPLIPGEKEIRKLREKHNVYSVMPGITGWAQVNGRDEITDEEKVLLDEEYVKKHNLLFDIKILFLTVKTVVTGKGFREGEKK